LATVTNMGKRDPMATRIGHIQERLHAISAERLAGIRRGIEKESLRTHPDGALALTPHPAQLGSPLTHPQITTDFCESQLELVTGVHDSVDACLQELRQIHQFVYRAIGDEMLWVGSMPCGLPADENIPIARYGSSNIGRAKSVYRMGLGFRYGRRMQTISGIHYNWSMPGLTSSDYFDLIRNFRRQSFLLLVLFGASPAVCASFVAGRAHGLRSIKGSTLGLPNATSLRMGRLGYQSDAQSSLAVSYNNLESYAASLEGALTSPFAGYERIGIRNPGGEYNQLSTSLLQIENEFYGTIRPKRVIFPGERPLHALRDRGVEYVEVRCMDLDPFVPIGIAESTVRFLDMFLLHCLCAQSPADTPQEIAAIARNQQTASERGREPGLILERGDQAIALADWAEELFEEIAPISSVIDAAYGGTHYGDALRSAHAALRDTKALPSARVLAVMSRDFDGSYVRFIRARSERARHELLGLPWTDLSASRFAQLAQASIADQQRIEESDTVEFEDYRQQLVSAQRLRP
jgi:glutamate--cysteine ligase